MSIPKIPYAEGVDEFQPRVTTLGCKSVKGANAEGVGNRTERSGLNLPILANPFRVARFSKDFIHPRVLPWAGIRERLRRTSKR